MPVIDVFDLKANPRSSKTGSVTDDIQESITSDPGTFPFKTKGLLLGVSQYERLERGRIQLIPKNPEIEGILDGGHNTLAIGLHILGLALDWGGETLPRGQKTWDDFEELWIKHRDLLDEYRQAMAKDPESDTLRFLIPMEILLPRDLDDLACVEEFQSNLIEICAARNNNVQLPDSTKANQLGYFDRLKDFVAAKEPDLLDRVEWKTNDGGDIKVQDLIALAWIPLGVDKDESKRLIEPVAPQKIYSAKGSCLQQFKKLMDSPEVTQKNGDGYRRELKDQEVESALRITADLPELYDYIYSEFPRLYNAVGGSYGRIIAVKKLNEHRKEKRTPFLGRPVETLSPDGFITPLVYGLQALMERKKVGERWEIGWRQPPMDFLEKNLKIIVSSYAGMLSVCDYDPQKVGKAPQSYRQALGAYKMARAGIL